MPHLSQSTDDVTPGRGILGLNISHFFIYSPVGPDKLPVRCDETPGSEIAIASQGKRSRTPTTEEEDGCACAGSGVSQVDGRWREAVQISLYNSVRRYLPPSCFRQQSKGAHVWRDREVVAGVIGLHYRQQSVYEHINLIISRIERGKEPVLRGMR